jgi:aminopeptidase
MPDPRRHAELLCDWCLEAGEHQQVAVTGGVGAAPLLVELKRALLARGAWPYLRTVLPGEEEAVAELAPDWALDEAPPLLLTEATGTDAAITVHAPDNTRALADADPARLQRLARSRAPVREAALRRRWCVTVWPTSALAQQAGMSLRAYDEFVTGALMLDRPDPVAAWRELTAFQERLVERLAQARELRIEAEGTDLTLRVEGRTWINSDGKRNMPSGEVFTAPHEDSATGRIRFTIPTNLPGRDVGVVELELRDGEVVGARTDKGQDHLDAILATDAGARRLGELGIGTNAGITRPTGLTLLDEKIGGTVHFALGRSYPETGGVNESAVHWDLVCDLRAGGRLTADGEVVQEDGRFAGV